MNSNSEAGCCCTLTECNECGTPGTGEEAEETGYRVLGLGLVQGAGDHPGGN